MSSGLRIMQVITRRELRGAEVVAADVCRVLRERGHEVLLAGLFQPTSGREAEVLAQRAGRAVDLGGAKRRGLDMRVAWKMRNAIREFRPDIVQANAFNALKFTALARMASRAQWPLVYRNVGVASQWVTRPGQRVWGRLLLRQVVHVISVSEASRADFSHTYGMPIEQIQFMHQGVHIPEVVDKPRMRQRLGQVAECPGNGPLLIHVGNFAAEKNHLGLLDAFQRILSYRPDCRMIFIGDGPLRKEIEKRVRADGLQDSVRLLGARTDAAELVGGADLMLMASHVEGIPGAVLEACAVAVPVIATRVGGLCEIVKHGETGRLVAAGDMEALARETRRLLEDAPLRDRMGMAARKFVTEHFNLEASVDELERLYQRLVGATRTPEVPTALPVQGQASDGW